MSVLIILGMHPAIESTAFEHVWWIHANLNAADPNIATALQILGHWASLTET